MQLCSIVDIPSCKRAACVTSYLQGLINIREISIAAKKLNNDKSPGSDGYSAEFFKCFFKEVGMFLLRSINYSFENGEMSITQKQGVITCIPKEGKDKSFLKTCRPVTLLNMPYKIASSCFAQRLKSVLPMIMHEDQKGFLNPFSTPACKISGLKRAHTRLKTVYFPVL